MDLASWAAVAGLLLIGMALGATVLSRLPITTAVLYLGAGIAASPLWLGWTSITLEEHAKPLELVAEVVVVLSLFTSGLKMSTGPGAGRWMPPLRLALLSMCATVALVAALGVFWLGLPLGAAILLGGILAPTDPVLASDVQLADPADRDRLRFALTGEAGLNDGTAFPFVMLGLGLLGLHEIGDHGWRWLAVDVIWAVSAGVTVGAVAGIGVGRLVLYLRRTHQEAVGLDNFLALGLIGLSYGAAIMVEGYGFLAVFAAGVALRRIEQQQTAAAEATPAASSPAAARSDAVAEALADPAGAPAARVATDSRHAPAFMAHAVLSFNEQIERIGEVVAVVAIGMLLWALRWPDASWLLVASVLLVVRPLSVAIGLAGSAISPVQRRLIGWFGIRGIGSLYYLLYAINHGLDRALADELAVLALSVVVVSIVVHGVSVTPLMNAYEVGKASRSDRR